MSVFLTYSCRLCGVTFIGTKAIHAASSHTWTHWPAVAGIKQRAVRR